MPKTQLQIADPNREQKGVGVWKG